MGGGLSTSPDLEVEEGLDDGEKALVGLLPIILLDFSPPPPIMALAKAGEKVDGVGELKVLVTEVLFESAEVVLKWNIVRCNLR